MQGKQNTLHKHPAILPRSVAAAPAFKQEETMGAHSRPRKGFNKTMAVAIAAGVAVTGGVQIAAPADSVMASKAHALQRTYPKWDGPSSVKAHSGWPTGGDGGAYDGAIQTHLSRLDDNLAYYDLFVMFPNYSIRSLNNPYESIESDRRAGSEITFEVKENFASGELSDAAKINPDATFDDWVIYGYTSPVDDRAKNGEGGSSRTAVRGQVYPAGTPNIELHPSSNSFTATLKDAPKNARGANSIIIREAIVVDLSKVDYGEQNITTPRIASVDIKVGGRDPVSNRSAGFIDDSDGYMQMPPLNSVQDPVLAQDILLKPSDLHVGDQVPGAWYFIDTSMPKMFQVKSVEWTNGVPSTDKEGTFDAPITVTYADGSTDTTNLKVTVSSDKDAYQNDPKGQKVSVKQNDPVPNAETGISNVAELTHVKSYDWKGGAPSTATVGTTKQTVVVTYNDGSTHEIVVDFEVTKATTNADDFQPTPVAQTVKYGDPAVTDANKLFSNWSTMPKGTTATPLNPPTSITKPVDVTYTIKYPDNTTDQVTVKHTPGKMADAFDPKGKNVKTELNGKPEAKTGIANIGDMPDGTTYTWKTAPKTNERGEFPATIVVKYSDNSTDEVPVNVIVEATDAAVYDPQPKPITVKNGESPKPETGILNPDKLPKGTTFTWEKAPDTSKPGKVNGVVRVKYPDGSTDDVSVPVTVTPIADEYAPKAKPLTVDNGDKPAAADGIANKPDLPKDVTYTWEKAPDTSKPGTTNPVAIVTYKDGSTDRVTVPVTVRPMAEVYNPIPQDVTVNRTKQPNAADAIKNKKDLPEGTKYAWKSPVDTSTGGKKPAVVVVTYPDGSREEVSTNVTVRPDNEVYTPTAKPITVNNGDTPNPADGIGNKNELPEGTKYTWEKAPDTSKPGNTEGVVAVTYPDGTKDRVTVPVTVRTQAEQFDPKPKPIESWTGENPPAIDGILNPDKLPKGTKFVWEKKPDTSKPGDTTGVVKVTYPDGSTDRVTVPVRVFLSGDDYQKILDDIAAHEKAIDDLNNEIDRINGEIGKLKGDVNTLKNQMKQAQKDIERLQDQVKKHQDEIDALKKRADKIEQRLDGHDKDIANLKKRVGDLEQRVGDAERRLDGIDKQVEQIMAELERLDGNEIVEGVRNPDNSITLVKKDGRTVEIAPATKYGLEKCTAQLGGGLMALVPTLIVLSQAGNAVHLPGFEQQMVALQKQAGIYNPQIADFVAKNGPALAAGAVGLAVIGTMFIPGTCGSDSIANALGESLRGNPDAANPDVRETHDFKGPRFVPKPGTEGETATAGSSLSVGKDPQPTTPADATTTPATGEGTAPAPETAAGATVPAPVTDNGTADVLADLAALAELGNDTEDFDLAVADAFAAK